MNKLGDIIKEKGLKKGYIAKKISVSTPTLQRYIEGVNYPGTDTAKKLSELLGYSIEEIFFAKNTINVVNEKSLSDVK
jgi:transcriptional regulator with XRE-family HTH domain